MFFVAEELREIMAELGFRKLDDMVGRSDLLEFVDLSKSLESEESGSVADSVSSRASRSATARCATSRSRIMASTTRWITSS